MKLKAIVFVLLFVMVLMPCLLVAETADLRINNPRVDGSDYKFELQIKRTDDWTVSGFLGGLGNSDFYWDRNAAAFTGSPTLSSIHSGISAHPTEYTIIAQETGGQLHVKITWTLVAGFYVWQPTLDTWEDICTVVWQIADPGENSGITWDQINTGLQDCDNPTDVITETYYGDGDISLPVTMTEMSATTSQEEGIVINWRTESETNTSGFNVLRSVTSKGSFQRINNSLIPGQGNSSSFYEYSFTDRNVQADIEYLYEIEEISFSGKSKIYGPIRVIGVDVVPDEFGLSYNYPNPFNPETTFKYRLAEDCEVSINIYNLLGEKIKRLVSGSKPAGYYTETWKGVSETGQRVSSGIYFIHMQAGTFSEVRKISLMR